MKAVGTCGHCGRDLPPGGDCYGCDADRLRGELSNEECDTAFWRERAAKAEA